MRGEAYVERGERQSGHLTTARKRRRQQRRQRQRIERSRRRGNRTSRDIRSRRQGRAETAARRRRRQSAATETAGRRQRQRDERASEIGPEESETASPEGPRRPGASRARGRSAGRTCSPGRTSTCPGEEAGGWARRVVTDQAPLESRPLSHAIGAPRAERGEGGGAHGMTTEPIAPTTSPMYQSGVHTTPVGILYLRGDTCAGRSEPLGRWNHLKSPSLLCASSRNAGSTCGTRCWCGSMVEGGSAFTGSRPRSWSRRVRRAAGQQQQQRRIEHQSLNLDLRSKRAPN